MEGSLLPTFEREKRLEEFTCDALAVPVVQELTNDTPCHLVFVALDYMGERKCSLLPRVDWIRNLVFVGDKLHYDAMDECHDIAM